MTRWKRWVREKSGGPIPGENQLVHEAAARWYRWPFRRPDIRDEGMRYLWDQTETWITASEWLAWLRRSGPRRSYCVYGKHSGGKWVPRSRPIIDAHFNKWSTRRWNERLP